MSLSRRFLREPLLHFLILGCVLFLVASLRSGSRQGAPGGKTLVVDDDALLTFMQYRSKAFEADYFTNEFKSMTPAQRDELVDQFIKDEMLYREAKNLKLEDNDYVIRQRLIQKMRFLIDDLAESSSAPDDETLRKYLARNSVRYKVEPAVTFTHVFADSSLHGDAGARALAEKLKAQLQASHAGFSDATQYGERFPFLENYVERTLDFVSSQFGLEFTKEIARIEPSESGWVGPVRSMYGYHVVLLTQRAEGHLPDFSELRQQVLEDWQRDHLEQVRAEAIDKLKATYSIQRKDSAVSK